MQISFKKIKKVTPKYLSGLTTHWDLGIFIALGVVLFVIPVAVALPHAPALSEVWVDFILTVLFLADAWRAKRDDPDELVGFRNISFQILSILPFQSIVLVTGLPSLWMPILQGARLFRAPLLYARMKSRSEKQLVQKLLKVGMVTYGCLIIVHWISCAWILIEPSKTIDSITVYNEALYWAITTLTTVGYGDVTPSGNMSRLYTMVIMVAGVGLYGLIIGQMSSLMLQSDKRKEANREKLEALTSLLNYYAVPVDVQDQAFDFYRHVLVKHASEAEEKVLKELPKALQVELQIYMNMKPLRKVSLFSNVSDNCLKSVAIKLKQVYLSPGDKIIEAGDVGKEMFVIGHGRVKVHLGDHHIADLSDGQCFGEMALIGDPERKADVTTAGYCDLFVLEKECFDDLLVSNNDLRKNVEAIVKKRAEENKKSSSPLSHSPQPINKLKK